MRRRDRVAIVLPMTRLVQIIRYNAKRTIDTKVWGGTFCASHRPRGTHVRTD